MDPVTALLLPIQTIQISQEYASQEWGYDECESVKLEINWVQRNADIKGIDINGMLILQKYKKR